MKGKDILDFHELQTILSVPTQVTVVPSAARLELAILKSLNRAQVHREGNPEHTGECAQNPPGPAYLSRLINEELYNDISKS